MAAPKGHSLWPSKEKFRKPKKFETPDDLLDAAIDYFKWCKEHPIYINDFVRSGPKAGKIVKIPTDRPFLIEGFCLHAGMTVQSFEHYTKKPAYENYFEVSHAIRDTIFNQNLEGGYTGGFNPMLVARKLGIREMIDNRIDDQRKSVDELFPPDDELMEGENIDSDKP